MPGISPKLPLISSRDDSGYSLNKTMSATVRQNLKHLLLTNPGEKVFDSRFGCGLKSFLFKQFSSGAEEEIVSKITQQISRYMAYVAIERLNVTLAEDENKLFVAVYYSVPSLSISDTLTLDIVRN